MKEQLTLGTGFEKYSKTTRREKFLTEMDRIVPWGELCALIVSAGMQKSPSMGNEISPTSAFERRVGNET